jgi:hypothetical protein
MVVSQSLELPVASLESWLVLLDCHNEAVPIEDIEDLLLTVVIFRVCN